MLPEQLRLPRACARLLQDIGAGFRHGKTPHLVLDNSPHTVVHTAAPRPRPWCRRLKNKKVPEGWELIEEVVEDFEQQMKEAVNEEHEGKRKAESTWKIHRIHWEKNRHGRAAERQRQEGFAALWVLAVCSQWASQPRVVLGPGGRWGVCLGLGALLTSGAPAARSAGLSTT